MAAEVSDSIETSEESETASGAESMLFICLVVANICLDGDTKAVDADGSRRSLAATKVSGKIFVAFIVRLVFGRGFFTSWLLPTPNKYNAAGESYPRYGMRIRHVCAVVLQDVTLFLARRSTFCSQCWIPS